MTEEGFRFCRALVGGLPEVTISESARTIRFPGEGEIQFRSADDADLLRGSGVDFLVVDEAALVDVRAWHVLRPSLGDRKGKAFFISTPRGRDWFAGLYDMGQDGHEDWQSWRFPSSANPYYDSAELEAERKILPERVFQQEHEAEFMAEGEGAVFSNITACSTGNPERPLEDGDYYGFLDIAGGGADFNVASVLRRNGRGFRQVHVSRWSGRSFEETEGKLAELAKRYAGAWAIDVSGQLHGAEVWAERLRQQRVNVSGMKFTGSNKGPMVLQLAAALEHGELILLKRDSSDAAAAQHRELLAYSATRSPTTGMVRYSAPSGSHDDCVAALLGAYALAKDSISPETYRRLSEMFDGGLAGLL